MGNLEGEKLYEWQNVPCSHCSLYHVVKAKVRAGGSLTDSFTCHSGPKQGEVCSPDLVSLFINELAKEIVQRGRHQEREVVNR